MLQYIGTLKRPCLSVPKMILEYSMLRASSPSSTLNPEQQKKLAARLDVANDVLDDVLFGIQVLIAGTMSGASQLLFRPEHLPPFSPEYYSSFGEGDFFATWIQSTTAAIGGFTLSGVVKALIMETVKYFERRALQLEPDQIPEEFERFAFSLGQSLKATGKFIPIAYAGFGGWTLAAPVIGFTGTQVAPHNDDAQYAFDSVLWLVAATIASLAMKTLTKLPGINLQLAWKAAFLIGVSMMGFAWGGLLSSHDAQVHCSKSDTHCQDSFKQYGPAFYAAFLVEAMAIIANLAVHAGPRVVNRVIKSIARAAESLGIFACTETGTDEEKGRLTATATSVQGGPAEMKDEANADAASPPTPVPT